MPALFDRDPAIKHLVTRACAPFPLLLKRRFRLRGHEKPFSADIYARNAFPHHRRFRAIITARTFNFLNRHDRLFQPRALEIGNDRQERRAIVLSMARIGNTGAPRVFNCCWTSGGLLARQTNFTAIIVSRLLTTILPWSLLPP